MSVSKNMLSENNKSILSKQITPNYTRYLKFLNQFRIDKGEEYTHVSCGDPKGSYYIDENKIKEFHNHYSQLVDTSTSIHMIERPKQVGPLTIDIDIQYDKLHSERQYTMEHIKCVVDLISTSLGSYFDVNYEMLMCYVFEKKKPTEVNKNNIIFYKDGIHIMYPNIPLNVEMRYFILNELRTEGNEIFDDIELLKNDVRDIYDEAVIIKNGWMMYGSKKEDGDVYRLTHIFDNDLKEYIDDKKFNPLQLINLLSIRKYNENESIKYRNEDEIDDYGLFEEKLLEVKVKYMSNTKKKNNKKTSEINVNVPKLDVRMYPLETKKKIERAIKLVDILNDRRASSYMEWISVGWALHNVHVNMLSVWINFSKRCPEKFDENTCIEIWKKADDSGFTLSSLHWWAREDNLMEYKKILYDDIKKLIGFAESGTHYDIALVLNEMYKYSFVCSSIKHNTWYEFSNNRWDTMEEGYNLRNKISSELYGEFYNLLSQYYGSCSRETETGESVQQNITMDQDKITKKCDQINKVLCNLKHNTFKKNIVDECKTLFYDKTFEEKLDANQYLIGFENGIYDLKKGQFREGTPDDYVKLSTKYNYKEFDKNDEIFDELNNLLDKIYVNKKIKQYVMVFLASCLCGVNKEQKCEFFTGTGANGKSTMMELIKYMFGEYYDTLPVTVLSRKRAGSSQATPELADKKGKRFIEIHEPEEDDKFNVGFLKELSASDNISTRHLYGAQFSYVPQFKIVICCNNLPHIPALDNGTWRRIRVVQHESEFIDGTPDSNNKFQFKKDKNLQSKLKAYRQAFMWLLINVYYKIYEKEGLIEPEEVTLSTTRYKSDSDNFLEFINDCIVVADKSDNESFVYIYDEYKRWFKEAHPNDKMATKRIFQSYLNNNNYPIKNGNIYGIKVKSAVIQTAL